MSIRYEPPHAAEASASKPGKEFKYSQKNIQESLFKKRWWLGEPNMCEICGMREATVNLDLTVGTHRECRDCWDFD